MYRTTSSPSSSSLPPSLFDIDGIKKWTFDFIANDVGNVEKCDITSSFKYEEFYAPLNGSVHFLL